MIADGFGVCTVLYIPSLVKVRTEQTSDTAPHRLFAASINIDIRTVLWVHLRSIYFPMARCVFPAVYGLQGINHHPRARQKRRRAQHTVF